MIMSIDCGLVACAQVSMAPLTGAAALLAAQRLWLHAPEGLLKC